MKPHPLHIGDDANGHPHFLSPQERTMGVHAMGAPGTGKSQAANYMLEQDERNLPGAILTLDPHGNDENSLYAQALARAVRYRPLRPTYFINLSQPRFVYGFNIFAQREGGDVSTRTQRCVRRLFTAWGEPDLYERPRLLYWSTGVFATGMHHGALGLTDLRLLLDHERAALRTHLTDGTPVESRFRALNQKRPEQFEEQVEAVRNRLDALTSAAAPRRFLSLIHPPAMLDFCTVFAQRARVYINLQDSADLDRDHSRVIGTLLAADFIEQACQRPDPKRAPVALYIDEAHRFISPDLATIFEEGRKFHVYTTLLHQHLDQLRQDQDERVLNAILSCARTKMVFALGSDRDAKQLVHEIFVGEHGLDYTEVKYVQPQTKFRPVAIREQSISRTRGGGTTDTEGESHGETHGNSVTQGRSRTQTQGDNEAQGESTGTTHTAGTSRSRTHTDGHGITWTKAKGVARGRNHTKSHAEGHVHTETEQHAMASTYGTISSHADGVTTPGDPALLATQTTTDTRGTTTQHNETHGYGMSDTTSETDTESDGESVTRSRVKSRAYGRNRSDAHAIGENKSHGESQIKTSTRGRSNSSADTDNEAQGATASESRGRNSSRGKNKTWGETITDGPGVRHEEFREDAPTFYTLEEQRQRTADALRLPPQRGFVLRRADCRNAQLTVPLRTPLRYSARVMLTQEARSAAKTGAVSCKEADALIDDRRRAIEAAAVVNLETRTPSNHLLPRRAPVSLPYERAPRKIAARRRIRPNPELKPVTRKIKPS